MAPRVYSYDEHGELWEVGGINRFVLVLDVGHGLLRPLTKRQSNGQTFHMTYKGRPNAFAARMQVELEGDFAEPVLIYDKHLGETVQ